MKNKFLLILAFLTLQSAAEAQNLELYQYEQFVSEGDTLGYRILYPEAFSASKQYPLVFVLHGAGERGNDNKAQLTHGGKLFLQQNVREEFPAIVVFPQVKKDDYWAQVEVERDSFPLQFNFRNTDAPTKAMKLLMALADELAAKPYTNANKIYVGGLSMGGMGTFEILSRKPQFFAAAFAICGGADPAIAEAYRKGLNIWIFHGEKDDVVPPELSKTMAREINSYGGNAKLSLYPNDNHNSWDSAFAEPYLLPWLFSITKNE
ncbi:carboxylesterase family protein [Salinimicrobium oceani]|uniref:Prolyl oligopeptidase family serine peptidase n=1 Tax=Salinimicrobium oceani TaxID=2722702 RepID=A0ABX1D0Q3_9FLAO|nr:prolyl oligopeptidase family serine peptidase [Salinimicrobium oceani]NJW54093.1 prolyl oligopeptidase family serine peptidase [Salinimicrobium oceani]